MELSTGIFTSLAKAVWERLTVLMFQVILADLIFIPLVILFIAKFGHRQEEPEWLQLSRMRKYMRSEEFRRKQKALEEEIMKKVIN